MEVEAKFTLSDAPTRARLADMPSLAGYDLGAGEARRDRDTFLDTADRRFLGAGYYLRRRETGGGVALTLKRLLLSKDGVLRREELEALVAADVPVGEWPAGPLRERVEQIAQGEELVALLSLKQERVARRVSRGGREVAELSLDEVLVTGAAGTRVWHEAEVEVRGEGTEDDLESLAVALRDELSLAPVSSSKFARALEYAEGGSAGGSEAAGEGKAAADESAEADGAEGTGEPPAGDVGADDAPGGPPASEAPGEAPAADTAPVVPDWRSAGLRRKRPAIARDDSMASAAQATLRLHYVKMLAHEAGTRLGEDSEELHDMRVATRRMRMALRLFEPWLDAKTMRPALKGMRRTGRTLGAVRDLDVFHEKTQKYIEQLPARRRDELEPLLAAWRVEYRVRRGDLVAYLDGGRYRRFVEGLGELLDGPPERLASSAASTVTVAQVLPGLLHHDLAEVLAAGSVVGGRETPLLRFHELRIAGKALRYTLEFFEAPLGRGVKPLIASMKELQDHLGDLQDAVVSSGILRDVITWGSWGAEGRDLPGHTDVALAPGVARYLLARQEEMDRLVVTFPEVWPVVAGEEFGSRLARLLARLQAPPRARGGGQAAGG